MNYATRHLVALQSMRYMGRELTAGEDFHPTEVDAGYFLENRMAEPAPAAPPAPQPETASAPARRGRPPRTVAPVADEPAAPAAAPAEQSAEAQAETPAAEVKSFVMGAGDLT